MTKYKMYRNRYYNGYALESLMESMMVTRDGRLVNDENEYCEYDPYNYHKDAICKMEGGLYNGEDLMSKSVARYLSEIKGKRTTLDDVKRHMELCTVQPSVYIDEKTRTLEIWYCYAPSTEGFTYKGSDYNTSHFSVGLALDDPDCLVTGNWRYGYSAGEDDMNRHIYESANSAVYESQRYFKLHDDERRALATEMGLACGNLGEDWETEKYSPFMDMLTPEEREQFSQCVDFLENEETYAYVSSRNLAPDLPLVRRFLMWMDEHDMFGENWDLMDAFGKICQK